MNTDKMTNEAFNIAYSLGFTIENVELFGDGLKMYLGAHRDRPCWATMNAAERRDAVIAVFEWLFAE